MSPLLRSELRLRVGRRRCCAELWRRGLRPRLAARATATVTGSEGDAVEQALQALERQGVRLPPRAVLTFEDDHLYFALLPAGSGFSGGELAARRYFADALGALELNVCVALSPGGRHWVAVAVESANLAQVGQTLAARGIVLRAAGAALLDDLHALPARLPADGVVALLREEGVVMLRCQNRGWTELGWERCDGSRPEQVERRIEAAAFRHSAAIGIGAATPPRPRVLVVVGHTLPMPQLAQTAAARGWALCQLAGLGAQPPRGGVAA